MSSRPAALALERQAQLLELLEIHLLELGLPRGVELDGEDFTQVDDRGPKPSSFASSFAARFALFVS